MRTGAAGDRTCAPLVSGRSGLPPEPQPPQYAAAEPDFVSCIQPEHSPS